MKFPQVHTVEASAGSGKTYCLSKRYIQLLLGLPRENNKIPLNTILAITFTNKAAMEMKARILQFLKEEALSGNLQARSAMDYIIRNYNFFQVQTIDSFINSILYGCSFKLGLSANFKTEELYRDYLSFSLDRLIDQAATDKAVLGLFKRFLNQYLYIENKSGWFPKQSIYLRMQSLFSKSNKYSKDFARNDITPKDIIACKKDILKLNSKLVKKLPEGTNSAFAKKLDSFLKENENGFGIEDISDFFKRPDFPARKGTHVSSQTIELWSDLRKVIANLCELESLSSFNYYIDIFDALSVILKDISGREDVLFLEALNKNACRLFDEKSIALPELYYRLAARFKHFLIDEFQDTSVLQWKNIFAMVENALSSDGSLFYVGDRKQAIYRFRAGEAGLMNLVKNHFKDFNLTQESLAKNYRSRKNIVDFNNNLFSEYNLERFLKQAQSAKKIKADLSAEDISEILSAFKDSGQQSADELVGGYVSVEKISSQEGLKTALYGAVDDLRKRFAPGEVAILTRKNDDVGMFTSWFLERGIPVESENTLNIKENYYIKEIVSFLKFLNSPIDNISFASFILGDIFSHSSGVPMQDIRDFIFGLRQAPDWNNIYLYKEFRLKFTGIWERFFEEFFKSVGFVPLYELVVSIYSRFKVIEKFSDQQGFFMRFIELIKQEESECAGISDFLEFFQDCEDEKLYVNAAESDSLKILTVHKAKGLEFKAVIIPMLTMNVKVSREIVVENDTSLSLLRIKRKYADFSQRLKQVHKDEYKKSFIDEINNIYVALTRAADELYVFVPEGSETSFNLAQILFTEDKIKIGAKLTAQCVKKDNGAKDSVIRIPSCAYKDLIDFIKREFRQDNILKGRDSILRGNILHYALSFVGNLDNQDKDLTLNLAFKKTAAKFVFIKDFKDIKSCLRRIVNDKGLGKYFYTKGADVFLEKDVVNSFGDTERIDRLIVSKKEIIVIDYKSTGDEGLKDDYRAQVVKYVNIIKHIYPGRMVKGVLLYLDSLTAEEVSFEQGN